jgi:hypothetical protein
VPLLPGLDIAGHNSEQRVRLRPLYDFQSIVQRWIADCELRQQMIPLVQELTARNCDVTNASRPTDLPRCKRVSATRAVRVNATKILRDRATRRHLSAESMQLRVLRVSVRAKAQYGLRQERLPPQRNEAAGVEVLGMHGPQPHSSTHLSTGPYRFGSS